MADEPKPYRTVARVGDVAEGQGIPIEFDGYRIALFLDGGVYFALDDFCPHQGVPLHDGFVCDKSVTCTFHGWRFGLEDGRWLDSPRIRVDTYPVRVVGDEIRISVKSTTSLLNDPSGVSPNMRAAYIEQTGPPENIRVGDLPKPQAGPGQALVRVGAAALNPIDLYLRSGLVAMPIPIPYIIGCDLAGTVEAVGVGATKFKVGDRVWGSNQGLLGRQGTAAEYAAVDEHWLYPTPAKLSDVEASAVALAGITAHLGLFQNGRLSPGETVYVSGGSGGVGSLVVQMVKAIGGKVATTAGSPERVELCRTLGADLALNYKTDDVPARLKEFAGEGIDVWFETQREPNLEVAIPLLRKRGRMIVMAGRTAKPTLPLGAFYPRDCSLIGFAMFNASPTEQARCAVDIGRWIEAGTLKPQVGKTFALAEAVEAERFLEANTLGGAGTLHGKVVLTIG